MLEVVLFFCDNFPLTVQFVTVFLFRRKPCNFLFLASFSHICFFFLVIVIASCRGDIKESIDKEKEKVGGQKEVIT